MNNEKDEGRLKLMELRLAMPPEYKQEASNIIVERLVREVDFSKINRLHVFEPIKSLGEVDITDFSDGIIHNHPRITLFTSRKINGKWREVNFFNGKVAVVEDLDVAVIPMLGFDEELQRIGYGGGYYDKFLSDKPDTIKIGICFEAGKIIRVPREPHDIAMNIIITEKQTYRC
jgi:5-formyltetrahydrofolate cyclo-ligase